MAWFLGTIMGNYAALIGDIPIFFRFNSYWITHDEKNNTVLSLLITCRCNFFPTHVGVHAADVERAPV